MGPRAAGLIACLLMACAAPADTVVVEGTFDQGRSLLLEGSQIVWEDAFHFNAGYERREPTALELLLSGAPFDDGEDLLFATKQKRLDLVHAFRFGDALRVRIQDSDALRVGTRLSTQSEQPSGELSLGLKVGAERLTEGVETDDVREAFRLAGQLALRLKVTAIERNEDMRIRSLSLTLELTVRRCEGEGPAYHEGDFEIQLHLTLDPERLAERNVKTLLGMSALPLPDPNGFAFSGFTQACMNNPRPPID